MTDHAGLITPEVCYDTEMPSSPEKHAAYLRKRYKNDPKYRAKHIALVRKNNKRYAQESRQVIADFKKQGCALCGEKEPCCLSAHHLKDKRFNIAEAVARKLGPKTVRRELEKCVCLCENCHRKVHAGILKLCSGVEERSPRKAHNLEIVGSNPTPAMTAGY